MNAWRVWGRLLWKELREGWLTLLMANLLPFVLFPAAAQFLRYSNERHYLTLIVGIGPLLAIALYAARKAQEKGRRTELATVLPGTPIQMWVASFLVPLALFGLAGALYGAMSRMPVSADLLTLRGAGAPYTSMLKEFSLAAVWTWAILFVACFAVCYMLSAAVSLWVSLAAGVAWVIYGQVLLDVMRGNLQFALDQIHFWIYFRTEGAVYILAIAGAAVVGCLIFTFLANRTSFRRRQLVSIGVTLVLILSVVTPKVITSMRESKDETWWSDTGSLWSPDKSVIAGTSENPDARKDWIRLKCTDYRSGTTVERAFLAPARILLPRDAEHIYIARLLGDKRSFEILIWNARAGTVASAATIRRSTGALKDRWGLGASVSPDGRYLLTGFHSSLGDGYDLWVVDLRANRGRMVAPNSYFRTDLAAWTDGRALLCQEGKCLVIDLKSMKAHYRQLEDGGGKI